MTARMAPGTIKPPFEYTATTPDKMLKQFSKRGTLSDPHRLMKPFLETGLTFSVVRNWFRNPGKLFSLFFFVFVFSYSLFSVLSLSS